MNIQYLRQFIAIAEELHFGRAAQRLHMSQPPLSQSLARLESALGFQLLDRTRRKVALTAAGEALLREVRPAIAQIDRAFTMAAKANAGELTEIHIGFVSSALHETIPVAMRVLGSAVPEARLKLQELSTDSQIDRLLDGRIDVGFIYPADRLEKDICTKVVGRYKFGVAIPEHWPLARKEQLDLIDLADQPFILFPFYERPDLHAAITAECRRRGFCLKIAQEVERSQTVIGLVSAGIGMSFANDATARQGYPGVTFRSINGLPPHFKVELSMAWLRRPATRRHETMVGELSAAFDADV